MIQSYIIGAGGGKVLLLERSVWMIAMFANKKIIITGGTGSLGVALTKRLLTLGVDTIRIFSRNENSQVTMASGLHDDRLRFLIGDIRDEKRLIRAFEGIDIVFHAAALKHVPVIEYNPFESIQTNVVGSQNVINACLEQDVETAVCIGTDKSVSPLNTYGATKLLMEKLFISANNYIDSTKHRTKFIALRYGNVMGSSGSVIPKFLKQSKNNQKITITDPNMTRFSITMNKALDFILKATDQGRGSEVFVPKLRAYSIMDVQTALAELFTDTGYEIVGIRPGEKLHETLINYDETRTMWELDGNYVLFDPLISEQAIEEKHPGIKKTESGHPYSSDRVEKISKDELKEIFGALDITPE